MNMGKEESGDKEKGLGTVTETQEVADSLELKHRLWEEARSWCV